MTRTSVVKRLLLSTLFGISSLWLWQCTGDQNQVQEPIVPETELGGYPDDPAFIDPSLDSSPSGLGDIDTAPTPLDQDPTGSDSLAQTDEMLDESFTGGAQELPEYGDPDPAQTEPLADIPADMGLDSNDAPTPIYSDSSSGKVTRYVDALLLNVRSGPSTRRPIVRRLLGGAKIEVEIRGSFAKIQDGQWVSTKFLSSTPTRKVTRSEVQEAWRRSRYKDTWTPPR